jgi:hypothetical protein
MGPLIAGDFPKIVSRGVIESASRIRNERVTELSRRPSRSSIEGFEVRQRPARDVVSRVIKLSSETRLEESTLPIVHQLFDPSAGAFRCCAQFFRVLARIIDIYRRSRLAYLRAVGP